MALSIPENPSDDEIDMAPMIDMVFLLLVFFLVASKLNVDQFREVALPRTVKAKVPEDRSNRLPVTVDINGDIFLGTTNMVTLEELGDLVKLRISQNANLKIFLRGDANVRHNHIRDVMKVCAENGCAQIIFSAHSDEEG